MGWEGAVPKYTRGGNNLAGALKQSFLTYQGRGRLEAGTTNLWLWWFVQGVQA